MTTYYKAVRPDGYDFHTGTIQWLPKKRLTRARTVKHPTSRVAIKGDHSTSLAVSTDPTNLPGARWPMRLCRVEPVPGALVIKTDERKRQSVAWRVVEELDPALRFGPNGSHVVALTAQANALTPAQARSLAAPWEAAREDAREAARYAALAAGRGAALAAARGAAWDAAWDSARDAALYAAWEAAWAAAALVARDLITTEHYDTITGPWRTAVGPIHPDDPPIEATP